MAKGSVRETLCYAFLLRCLHQDLDIAVKIMLTIAVPSPSVTFKKQHVCGEL